MEKDWEAYSAGTHPEGYVHPKAVQALAEIGIIHSGYSKNLSEFSNANFDLVVTVCDAAAEGCPLWLGSGQRLHLGFPDPAKIRGTEAEIMSAFRLVRDEIANKIPQLLIKYS